MGNVETVQQIYAAFGAGDVPAILGHLADDVRWDHWAPTSRTGSAVPYLASRTGREDVAGFFGVAAGALAFERFEPVAFLTSEDQVAVVIEITATATATGTTIQDTEVHLFTFDADGKVSALRHFADTLQHAEAQNA